MVTKYQESAEYNLNYCTFTPSYIYLNDSVKIEIYWERNRLCHTTINSLETS